MFDESFVKESNWTEKNDLELMEAILEQDAYSVDELDFSSDSIDNGRTPEQNETRWTILIKGILGVRPGQRVNPIQVA